MYLRSVLTKDFNRFRRLHPSICYFLKFTGSKIIVDRTGDRNLDRTRRVTLTGTAKQVEHAKKLVNDQIAAEKMHGRKLPKIANQG